MTDSTKQFLQNAINHLSEEDCVAVMEFVQALQHQNSSVLKRLAADPTFTLPSTHPSFQPIQAVFSKGISASEQLLEERR